MADSKAKDHDKTWLHYDYAKCLIVSRNYETARDLVLPIVRTKVSEFWAWGALAATYVDSNPSKAVACFAKGLGECREAQFSVKMRGSLASLLASGPDKVPRETDTTIDERLLTSLCRTQP